MDDDTVAAGSPVLRLPVPRELAAAVLRSGRAHDVLASAASSAVAEGFGDEDTAAVVDHRIVGPDGIVVVLRGDGDVVTADALWGLWTLFIASLRDGVELHPGGARPDDRCFTSEVRAHARARGDSTALEDASSSFTYRDLTGLSRAVAGRCTGVVGVFGLASARFFAAAFAVMDASATYLPLDANQPVRRLAHMVRAASCRTIIDVTGEDGAASAELVRDLTDVRLVPWDELVGGPADVPATSDTPAYVTFTSGTTGTPRGAVIGRRALWHLCRWVRETLGLDAATVVSQVASVSFDASSLEVWPALAAGACVRIAPPDARVDPFELAEWLVAEEIGYCFAPTPLAELLMEAEWPAAPALKALGTGGDRLHRVPPDLPFAVLNQYGPTECTIVATADWVDPAGEELPPIGRVLPHGHHLVVSETGSPVPRGTTGELWIGGEGVGLGYANDPAATRQKFVPNPHSPRGERVYRTGDLVRERADGRIEFVGRGDRQVKISGARVELGEVESAVRAVPGVATAVADVVREPAGLTLAIFVVGRDEEDLPARIRSELPAYLRHSRLVFVDTLPLTRNGKIDLRALRQRVTQR